MQCKLEDGRRGSTQRSSSHASLAESAAAGPCCMQAVGSACLQDWLPHMVFLSKEYSFQPLTLK